MRSFSHVDAAFNRHIMRIAFILSEFPTLSETFILNQITGLLDRGHEVNIFALSRGRVTKVHKDVLQYGLLQRTFYVPEIPPNKFKRLLKGVYLFVTNFHRNPMALIRSLNIFKYGKQAASLRLLYTVILLVGKEPYGIVHAHFGSIGLLAAKMQRFGAINGKLITSFHGYDANVFPRINGNGCYKELFYAVELCTVSSDFIRQRVKALGAEEVKLVKHPVGVDTKGFVPKNHRANTHQEIVIATVARLVKVKGLEYAIRAIAKVVQKFPNIQYEIAGSGPLEHKLKGLAQDLGISSSVHFLGAQTQEQIKKLYDRAHIFVLSGVRTADGAEEGQGVVLLEAQAAGLPVVATCVGGIPESIMDGESGFLVPERDVDALAEKLIYLIEHPEIWPEMGRAGRAHVEANYDIDELNDRLVEIYTRLINDP